MNVVGFARAIEGALPGESQPSVLASILMAEDYRRNPSGLGNKTSIVYSAQIGARTFEVTIESTSRFDQAESFIPEGHPGRENLKREKDFFDARFSYHSTKITTGSRFSGFVEAVRPVLEKA